MKMVGAYGRVGELVSQRIVIAKILMTIATINQIPVTKLFFFDKDQDRLVLICAHSDLRAALGVPIKPERRRYIGMYGLCDGMWITIKL